MDHLLSIDHLKYVAKAFRDHPSLPQVKENIIKKASDISQGHPWLALPIFQ